MTAPLVGHDSMTDLAEQPRPRVRVRIGTDFSAVECNPADPGPAAAACTQPAIRVAAARGPRAPRQGSLPPSRCPNFGMHALRQRSLADEGEASALAET